MNLELTTAGGSRLPEKRREPRRKTSLEAAVRLAGGPEDAWLPVRLVDVSESGFRLSHMHAGFAAGQLLDFRHPFATGLARVVWNRIIDQRVETGCMVLRRS